MYRKLINSRYLTQLLTLAIIIFIFQYSSKALADNSCMKAELAAEIQSIGPLIPGPDPTARADLIYYFEDGSVRDGVATIFLIEPPKFTEDGTIQLTLDVVHDLGSADIIVWRIIQKHSPTAIPGENTVNERLSMLSGTGIFTDTFGRGNGHGGSDFNNLTGFISGRVRLCDSF